MTTATICPQFIGGPNLQLQDIALQLGGTKILKGIDWKVTAGQIHALVGPNGCGKSSLLKTILGLMPHTGEVAIHWQEHIGTIGYVPQAIECDPTLPMTVRDFLGAMCQKRPLFLGLHGKTVQRIHHVLEQVGMVSKANRRMGDLSGGERQRVLLAQSLLPQPNLLLLDEPMSALDTEGHKVFEQLLAQWRKDKVTIIWVEHDLDAVERLADKVTGLKNGTILFTEQPQILRCAKQILNLFSHRPVQTQCTSNKSLEAEK